MWLSSYFISVKPALDLLEDVHFLREHCVVDFTVGDTGDVVISCFCRGQLLRHYVEV